jgi:hypothetical protein
MLSLILDNILFIVHIVIRSSDLCSLPVQETLRKARHMKTQNAQTIMERTASSLRLFGLTGSVTPTGQWQYEDRKKRKIVRDPKPISCIIERLLAADAFVRQQHRVAYVVMNNLMAIRLFQEGKLSDKCIEQAAVGEHAVYFHDVIFAVGIGMSQFTIKVCRLPEQEAKIMTVDAYLRPIAGQTIIWSASDN